MSTFPYAYPRVFIGSGKVRTTGSTKDLAPGELGLFDSKSFKALAVGDTYSAHREVILAQGSFHTIETLALGHGGYKDSIKSRPINGHFVSDFRVSHPTRPQNHIIAIGYDGVSTTKTITAEADKDYFLRIDVKGEPVYRYMQHQLYHEFHVKAPCGEPCNNECVESIDANIIADDFVQQINEHPYIKNFVKAEKIVNCTPDVPAGADDVAHTLYIITLCDTGDLPALSDVQSQYTGLIVSRIAREGSLSTYEICQPSATSAPAAYQPANQRIVPDCTTCPTGFTYNAILYKYEVFREDAGTSGATTTLISNYSATAAVRLSYEYGTSKYVIYKTTNAVIAPFAVGDTVIQTNQFEEKVCVETTTPDTLPWASNGTRYKTTRNLQLTVNKTCGGGNRLTDIRAFYTSIASNLVGGTSGITVLTAGDCADIYTVDQYNDECLLDPCGGKDTPSFTSLQSFEGVVWEVQPAPALPDGTTCLVGIRLSGAYVDTKFGECSFSPWDHYELDMPIINVSQKDFDGDRCTDTWPVTELQAPKYASGLGEKVRRDLIEYLNYRQEPYFCDPRMRETQNLDPVLNIVDRSKYYKIYYLTYNVPYLNNSTNMYNNEQYELYIAFPEGVDTKPFENLINGYTSSIGIQLRAL